METTLPEEAPSTQSKETDLEVGRWGEELVYRFLLQHQKESAEGWQVQWLNEAFNTGTPYDIHIRQVAAFSSCLAWPGHTKIAARHCVQKVLQAAIGVAALLGGFHDSADKCNTQYIELTS